MSRYKPPSASSITHAEKLKRLLDDLEGARNDRTLVLSDQDRKLFHDIKAAAAVDFAIFYKEDKAQTDSVLTRCISLLLTLRDHDHSIRSISLEVLNAVMKALIMSFEANRLIIYLFTFLKNEQPIQGRIDALTKLSVLMEMGRASKITSYGHHVLCALISFCSRSEEIFHTTIYNEVAKLIAPFGSRIEEHLTVKADELCESALHNLEKGGYKARASIAILQQLSNYSFLIKFRVQRECLMKLEKENENVNSLVGYMNLLKSMWTTIKLNEDDQLDAILWRTLTSLQSEHSSLVVAALELIPVLLSEFDKHLMDPVQPFLSQYQTEESISAELNKTDSEASLEALENALNDAMDTTEIIDPLLNSDKYEEVSRRSSISSTTQSKPEKTPSLTRSASRHLPNCSSNPSTDSMYVYIACLLAERFLLSNRMGLKKEREVRTSHKILAMKALATVSKHIQLENCQVSYGGYSQTIMDVSRFIFAEDNQLVAATVTLLVNIDSYPDRSPDLKDFISHYDRVIQSQKPIPVRALLQALIGKQALMIEHDLTDKVIGMAIRETRSTYYPLQITIAEFLGSLRWWCFPPEVVAKWQIEVLNALITLSFEENPKVSQYAISCLPRFIRSYKHPEFEPGISYEKSDIVNDLYPTDGVNCVPTIRNLSPEFHPFQLDADYESNKLLSYVLDIIFQRTTSNSQIYGGYLVEILIVLIQEFPLIPYSVGYGDIFGDHQNIHDMIMDYCKNDCQNPQQYQSCLHVLCRMFASHQVKQLRDAASLDPSEYERHELPEIRDYNVFIELVQQTIRVINLYYSIVTDHKSNLEQSQVSVLARPNLGMSRGLRINEISRLVGTRIIPMHNSFLLSPSLTRLVTGLQGGYHIYLETVGEQEDEKFLGLLKGALLSLGIILEVIPFHHIKQMFSELVLYMKVVFELAPLESTKVLHQLFKSVFATNTINLNLNMLNLIRAPAKKKDEHDVDGFSSDEDDDDDDDTSSHFLSDFGKYCAELDSTNLIGVYVKRRAGWMGNSIISKVHVPQPNDVHDALKQMEKPLTRVLSIYLHTHCVQIRRSVLSLFSELLVNKVMYNIVDPANKLLTAVTNEMNFPAGSNSGVLHSIAQFLIVLGRTKVLQWDDIRARALALLKNIEKDNADGIFAAMEVFMLEFLYRIPNGADDLVREFRSAFAKMWPCALSSGLRTWIVVAQKYRHIEIDRRAYIKIAQYFFDSFIRNHDEWEVTIEHVYLNTMAMKCAMKYISPLSLFGYLKQIMKSASEVSPLQQLMIAAPYVCNLLSLEIEEEEIANLLPESDYGKEGGPVKTDKTVTLDILASYIVRVLKSAAGITQRSSVGEQHLMSILSVMNTMLLEGTCPFGLQLHDAVRESWFDGGNLRTDEYLSSKPKALITSLLLMLNLSGIPVDQVVDPLSKFSLILSLEQRDGFFTYPQSINLLLCSSPQSLCSLFRGMLPSIKGLKPKREGSTSCSSSDSEGEAAKDSVVPARNPTFRFRGPSRAQREKAKQQRESEYIGSIKTICNHLEYVDRNFRTISEDDNIKYANFYTSTVQPSLDLLQTELGNARQKEGALFGEFLLEVLPRVKKITSQNGSDWGEFSKYDVRIMFNQLVGEILVKNSDLNSVRWLGLASMLDNRSVVRCFNDEHLFLLPEMITIMKAFSDRILRENRSIIPYELPSTSAQELILSFPTMFNVTYNSYGGLDVVLRHLYYRIQYLSALFHSIKDKKKFTANDEIFFKVLFRHPVLYQLAIFPASVLRSVPLHITVSPEGVVKVPLINIHLLNNTDILSDFLWRTNWLGWVTRTQFEGIYMSLFGVLCSTPTGTEITSEASEAQIVASSQAVEGLTDLLLHTLLYPTPGDTVNGVFLLRTREQPDIDGNVIATQQLQCQLINRLERSLSCDVTKLRPNLERREYRGEVYHLGQVSAMGLWLLTGVLSAEDSQKVQASVPRHPRLKNSVSEFLLSTSNSLDTGSSVRALFENFTHWFDRGRNEMPLKLLSATVRAMSLLSDLFDQTDSYTFLYREFRNIFKSQMLAEHSANGYVIYTLLKASTVVGLENIDPTLKKSEITSLVLSWVECGLKSTHSFVRESTLHGVLYLMQSISVDNLKPVFDLVVSYLLARIRMQLRDTHVDEPNPIQRASVGTEYSNLMWSVAFQVIVEPLPAANKEELVKLICDGFKIKNLPHYLLSTMTGGAELLIAHSEEYYLRFLNVVAGLLENYSMNNPIFIFAMKMFVACMCRENTGVYGRGNADAVQVYETILEELFMILIRCESSDAILICEVLPSILIRHYGMQKALKMLVANVLNLQQKESQNLRHILVMVYEVYYAYRCILHQIVNQPNTQMSVLNNLAQVNLQPEIDDIINTRGYMWRAIVISLLTAASSDEAARGVFLLCQQHMLDSGDSTYVFMYEKAMQFPKVWK